MKRTWSIILSIVVWIALVAYILASVRMCNKKQELILINQVNITVTDQEKIEIITPQIIESWLLKGGYQFKNLAVGKINTHEIKEFIEKHGTVKSARVYSDMDGSLNIDVSQRRPIVRINTYNGYNFYTTADDWIISIQPARPVYVPIITGTFAFPFGRDYEGSIAQLAESIQSKEEQAKDLFQSKIVELDKVRQSARAEHSSNRALVRRDKKRVSRMRNEQDREILMQDVRARERELERQFYAKLKDVRRRFEEIAEKERQRLSVQKKEQQNYTYLLKLINFVKTINRDSFWSSQIVQINIKPQPDSGGGVSDAGANYWIEPDIELIPRVGKHIVLFGTLDNVEKKLDKLMLFYEKVLNHQGWDKYATINLKYRGQVVCRKRPNIE